MDRGEFLKLLKTMKSLYTQPNFIPDEDAAELWYDLLKDIDFDLANKAVRNHMATSKFPPMPSDIREKAYEYTADEYMSPLAAWEVAYRAISDSNRYEDSVRHFNELPPIIQKVIGHPENLREMSVMDIETVKSVEQSHFIKSYMVEVERDKKVQALPENLRRLATETAKRLSGE